MKRLAFLTTPVCAALSWTAVAEIVTHDLWLGSITLAAAIYVFFVPVLQFPDCETDASTASAPSADHDPSTGAFEAAPVGNLER